VKILSFEEYSDKIRGDPNYVKKFNEYMKNKDDINILDISLFNIINHINTKLGKKLYIGDTENKNLLP
jgi:hypothetical protein